MVQTKSAKDFAQEFLHSLRSGNRITLQSLNGIYVHPEVKDELVVVALVAGDTKGEGGQGMAFALRKQKAVELITELAKGLAQVGGLDVDTKKSGDNTLTVSFDLDLSKTREENPS